MRMDRAIRYRIGRIRNRLKPKGFVPTSIGDVPFKMSLTDPSRELVNRQVVHFATKMRAARRGERESIGLIQRIYQRGWVALDVGAWMGPYTVLFSSLAGDDGKVFALEPDERAYELLLRNIHLNSLRNVHAVKVALSDRIGVQELLGNNGYGVAESHLAELVTDDHRAEALQLIESGMMVNCTTLDRFVRETVNSSIDLIKIDVEGAEKAILENGLEVLSNNDLIVILELHNDILRANGVDPATVVRLLVQADMEVFQITELGLAGINDGFYQRPNPHLLAARGEKTSLVRTELAAGAGLP